MALAQPASMKRLTIPRGTSVPLTATLRQELTSALFEAQSIPAIQGALDTSLRSSGWHEQLYAHILDIMRSGECHTQEQLMTRLLANLRSGLEVDVGKGKSKDSGDLLRVPPEAIDRAVRVVRSEVDKVCAVQEEQ